MFFNAVWAFFPLWILKEAHSSIKDAFAAMERAPKRSLDEGKLINNMQNK